MQIPGYSQLTRAYNKLSPFEFGVFVVLLVILIVSVVGLAGNLQDELSTITPAQGGSYSEGIVGFPRYVNPVLARTNADQDIAALVYAGLTKLTADGETELDLASDMKVSEDGDTYTFTIRNNAEFHDGHPVTAEDVVYTITMLQDQRINSPYQADWSGVTARATDEKTVVFNLSESFQSFPYNARIGILPKHRWQEESTSSFPFSSLNTSPIGAGPYEIDDIKRNDESIPTEYTLTASNHYPDMPYIKEIKLKFFPDRASRKEAFSGRNIQAMYGTNLTEVSKINTEGSQVIKEPMNRVFGAYFNQNNNETLVDGAVRKALHDAIPKQKIIDEVLAGYGSPIDGPLPADSSSKTVTTDKIAIEDIKENLTDAGWVMDEGQRTKDGEVLSLTLKTAAIPALQQTADIIAQRWEELGITTKVTALPTNELSQEVIRPRDYEVLLFGQSINQSLDLYPFWHSDGQDDPGLNLAMYANTKTDEALTDWRTTSSSSKRAELQQAVLDAIAEDNPAAFIYSPAFIYIMPKEVKNIQLPSITTPSDRFAQIEDWYIETNKLWNVFSENESRTSEEDMPTSSVPTSK